MAKPLTIWDFVKGKERKKLQLPENYVVIPLPKESKNLRVDLSQAEKDRPLASVESIIQFANSEVIYLQDFALDWWFTPSLIRRRDFDKLDLELYAQQGMLIILRLIAFPRSRTHVSCRTDFKDANPDVWHRLAAKYELPIYHRDSMLEFLSGLFKAPKAHGFLSIILDYAAMHREEAKQQYRLCAKAIPQSLSRAAWHYQQSTKTIGVLFIRAEYKKDTHHLQVLEHSYQPDCPDASRYQCMTTKLEFRPVFQPLSSTLHKMMMMTDWFLDRFVNV